MKIASGKRAVFLDRDGVLNHDKGYVHEPSDLRILPGVVEALNLLNSRDFLLIVVTNQSGVARGKFTMEAVERFHTTMRQKLSEQGSPDIAAWYVCPHLPDATVEACRVDCDCRKPRPGLLLRAAQDLNIDLKQSWMIGDKESDVGCGLSAGLKGTVQVTGDTNYPLHSKASWHCNTILEAARWIGSQVQQGY